MRWVIAFFVAPLVMSAMTTQTAINVRGKAQPIEVLHARGSAKGSVLFLPGDGGWRGLAVTVAQTMADWGYDVYGFDTKHYLESFTGTSNKLTTELMGRDMETVLRWVQNQGAKPPIVLGWSQGAAMAVLAASQTPGSSRGLVAWGLPPTGVLGWTWKETITSVARLENDQPTFRVEPLLRDIQKLPVWMIYGAQDEYIAPAEMDRLYAAASAPKWFEKAPGANHRFDGHQAELLASLAKGLQWVDETHLASH